MSKFVASMDELKRVFKKIEKADAKWDGEECPDCYLTLKKRDKILLSGLVLECPSCNKGFDRAEDYIQSALTKLQYTEESFDDMDSKVVRAIQKSDAKQNHSLKDFT